MTFNEFQNHCVSTAIYPNVGANLPYTVLGLCGESGEVAEKVKKLIRDHGGKVTEDKRLEILKELADVLWYVATTSMELKAPLQEVVDLGVAKYADRKARGVLHGEGDNR